MKEEERQRAIRIRLARGECRPAAGIPTGFRALDDVLGTGGWPRGALVEIYGPPSAGKTALLLASIAHLQSAGAAAAWIDADHTFDPAWAAQLGIELERLPVAQPASAEEALAVAQQLAASRALDLLVIDSVAALVPSLELEAGIGDHSPGLHGRVLGSGLRRLSAAASKSSVAVVLVNQSRSRRDIAGEEFETSAGSADLKLLTAVRILMEFSAGGARLKVVRNKLAAGAPEGRLAWKTGHGFVKSP
jgi:recombination protein RecA